MPAPTRALEGPSDAGETRLVRKYMNPVWGPNAKRQWYTMMEGPQRFVVVPARAIVHASFEMRLASGNDGAKDARAKDALKKSSRGSRDYHGGAAHAGPDRRVKEGRRGQERRS